MQTEKQAQQLAIHSRFYTALALHDLVNEVPLPRVSEKYQGRNSIENFLSQNMSHNLSQVILEVLRLVCTWRPL